MSSSLLLEMHRRRLPFLTTPFQNLHSACRLSVSADRRSWEQSPSATPAPPDARRHVERDKCILLATGNEHASMPVLLDHHLAASLHAAATTATATTTAGPTTSPARYTSKMSGAALLIREVVGAAVLRCCLVTSSVLLLLRLLPLSDLRRGCPSLRWVGSSYLAGAELLCCELLRTV